MLLCNGEMTDNVKYGKKNFLVKMNQKYRIRKGIKKTFLALWFQNSKKKFKITYFLGFGVFFVFFLERSICIYGNNIVLQKYLSIKIENPQPVLFTENPTGQSN